MKTRRIHCFQHVDFEDPGFITSWALANNTEISFTHFGQNNPIPGEDEFDLLLIMGGPMSTCEEDKYPWLHEEKKAISHFIQRGKKVLGICLGSQLLAEVLGAKVYPNNTKEIGWFNIYATDEGRQYLFDNKINSLPVFHWHGDTFDLPEGADWLAYSEVCRNQAFAWKEQVIGLQFHLEITEENLEKMLYHGVNELVPDLYIQPPEIIKANKHHISNCNHYMAEILAKLLTQ